MLPLSLLASISLDEAVKSEQLTVACRGIDSMAHYGECLAVYMINKGDEEISVEIERGMVFQAKPLNYQNFIVTRPEIVVIGPGEKVGQTVQAMCIESSDSGPNAETSFSYLGRTDDDMAKLLAYLDEQDLMNPLGQEAVWTLANKEPVGQFYANDTISARKLENFMEEQFDLPESWGEYEGSDSPPEPVYTEMRIGGMVEYYSSRSGDEVYIALFNTDGVLERELYHNPDFPSGKVKVEYEFNAAEFRAPAYLIRLTIDGVIKYEREVDLSVLPNRE
jgi:hypothetical protein